jgi:hypothetical protein
MQELVFVVEYGGERVPLTVHPLRDRCRISGGMESISLAAERLAANSVLLATEDDLKAVAAQGFCRRLHEAGWNRILVVHQDCRGKNPVDQAVEVPCLRVPDCKLTSYGFDFQPGPGSGILVRFPKMKSFAATERGG